MCLFDAYFFDFDGTVGDTAPDIRSSWLLAIEKLQLPTENFQTNFRIGPSISETAALLYPQYPEKHLELQNAYKHYYDEINTYSGTTPYPGLPEAIKMLHSNGKKVYIVTNKRLMPLTKLMKIFALTPYCSGIFVPDILETGMHITKNELAALALRVSGVSGERALMIGDTEIDIAAGRYAGMKTCAVSWGYGKLSVLQQAQPDYQIDSIDELP